MIKDKLGLLIGYFLVIQMVVVYVMYLEGSSSMMGKFLVFAVTSSLIYYIVTLYMRKGDIEAREEGVIAAIIVNFSEEGIKSMERVGNDYIVRTMTGETYCVEVSREDNKSIIKITDKVVESV